MEKTIKAPATSTAFTDLVGVDHPIALAPMAGAVESDLAAAVGNAGGYPIIPFSWSSRDTIEAELTSLRAKTDAPFAVNLCLDMPQEARLELCLSHRPNAVHFFWGDAAPFVKQVHTNGALVIQTVSTAIDAKHAVDAGVDILVAQGWEAGGHVRGMVATLPLIPAVVDMAGSVPVLAAGGISDGRGLAAALCLGASGVVMGTRFLATPESAAHSEYIAQLIAAQHSDTLHETDLYNVGWSNAAHRVLRNAVADRWLAEGRPGNNTRHRSGETVAMRGSAPIKAYQSTTPHHSMTGEIEALSMWAGQSVGLVNSVERAGTIIDSIMEHARAALHMR
ncbi:nitronate monooxygenase [Rhodobacteraceae bacterium B1Z28]|uniref:Nitronate monooxygenase n=1 Tax=Ruegeria haliotis TaxID=2747601 RepID=A0ABX2PRW6_9RHOB|nr:nitronate monooxygenase [Ruegeria haliotis]NVO56910.1 nitronate monooxygenase [Ruegeria haliotis]